MLYTLYMHFYQVKVVSSRDSYRDVWYHVQTETHNGTKVKFIQCMS